MTIRKRLLCLMLAASMLIVGLTGCKDSSNETNTVQVDYNAEEEVAKYKDYLGEIPEADKDLWLNWATTTVTTWLHRWLVKAAVSLTHWGLP